MESSYIFSPNTLSLYHIWGDQPLDVVAQRYPEIIANLSERQRNQYNLWRALPKATRDHIEASNSQIVVNLKTYPVIKIDFPQLEELAERNLIASAKAIDDEHVQVSDRHGNNYIVYARYDPATNQILPR